MWRNRGILPSEIPEAIGKGIFYIYYSKFQAIRKGCKGQKNPCAYTREHLESGTDAGFHKRRSGHIKVLQLTTWWKVQVQWLISCRGTKLLMVKNITLLGDVGGLIHMPFTCDTNALPLSYNPCYRDPDQDMWKYQHLS